MRVDSGDPSNAKTLNNKVHGTVRYPRIPKVTCMLLEPINQCTRPLVFLSRMAPRRRTTDAGHSHPEAQAKTLKKGFSVGPANLPDGTHRRKGTATYLLEGKLHRLIDRQSKRSSKTSSGKPKSRNPTASSENENSPTQKNLPSTPLLLLLLQNKNPPHR